MVLIIFTEMFNKQSVFLKSDKTSTQPVLNARFALLGSDTSDSERESEIVATEPDIQPGTLTFKKKREIQVPLAREASSASADGWEDVRNNKQRSVKKSGEQYTKPSQNFGQGKKPFVKRGSKKNETTSVHDKQARATVHNLIKEFCNGTHIADIAMTFKNAIDAEKSHYAKGKLLEVATSYLLHELLSHELVYPYFNESNVREGDGHNALFWVAWSEYFKYSIRLAEEFATGKIIENPLAGFSRTINDALITIDLLFDVGYTSTSKNRHGETAVRSLELACNEGKIPIEWHQPIKDKYVNISQKSAEVTLREICSRISTDAEILEKYKTLYCLGFYKAPQFAAQLAVEFCIKLTPGCIGRGIVWGPVVDKINMFRSMISTFHTVMNSSVPPQDYVDFADAFVGWKRNTQLNLFNQLVTQQTLDLIAKVDQVNILKALPENASRTNWEYETCFIDPLAGVIGECGSDAQKKEYILQKLLSVDTMMLGLYCISHSKFMDQGIKNALFDICMLQEFESNSRLKFALYDVIERVCNQKMKNLEQCKAFLQGAYAHREKSSEQSSKCTKAHEPSEPVEDFDQFEQLNEQFCEQLRVHAKKFFDGESATSYVDELRKLSTISSTNQQILVESFIARSFTDVFNAPKLERFKGVVAECKAQRIFKPNAVRSAIAKMNRIELGDFFESGILEEVKTVILTL